MKTGNVILAIFLWLCIPLITGLSFFGGAMFSIASGDTTGGVLCCFGAPLALFIAGVVVLVMGRENHSHYKTKSDRTCPNCGRVIPFDARICPYCRKDFNLK